MRIFLTGGTGFIGAYLLRELLQIKDVQITANYRSSSRFDLIPDIKSQINWVELDLDDLMGLEEILGDTDTVVHSAGMISFLPKDRARLHKTNAGYTANLVNLSLETGVKRFIHYSSATALGVAKEGQQLDEASVWTEEKAFSQYALSKYLGEREVWRGFAEGLHGAIINPTIVIGAGRWDEGVCKIFNEVNKGYRYCPAGSNGMVDVRDVAKMTRWLIEHPEFDQRRVICSAANISMKDLLMKISALLGKKGPTISLNSSEGKWVQRFAKLLAFIAPTLSPISSEELKLSNMPFQYDNTDSVEKIGFQYRSPDDTLADTAAAFKAGKTIF